MKYRPINLLIPFVLITAMGCSETSEDNIIESSPLVAYADSLFNIHVDSAHIAGASVILARGGEVLLDKSYGYASLELSVPMPEEASFEIGSVSKQFTAAAILKLVEEGKLSLEDDFTQYLEFDTKGRTVTVAQLLNHTSGIPGYTEMPDFWPLSIHDYERDSLVRLVESKDFLFEPGDAMIYNNSAYFFLGLIIEKVSEMTYEEFLIEQFFLPLGMHNTYYCSTSKVIKNKAYGYQYSPDGLVQKPYLDHTWPFAAGSLCSTTRDLLTWLQALHGGEVLSEKSYQMMVTPESLNDGSQLRYAMGLSHYMDFGNELIGHGGGINGFLSSTGYYPQQDFVVICLVNTTGPQGAGFFTDQLTWKVLEKMETQGVEMEGSLASLAGTYSGPVRGQDISVQVDVLLDGITLLPEGGEEPDTVRTYIGDNTWMDGNDLISIKDGLLRVDQVGGYYVLRKE
jgi:CubicO group peptidase (beta-lactamase class C family)